MKKSESRPKNPVPDKPDQTKLIPNPTQNPETPLQPMTLLRLLSLRTRCQILVEGTRNSVVCAPSIDLFRIVGNGVVVIIIGGGAVISSVVATGNIARICITVAKIHSRTTSRGRLRAGFSLRAVSLGLVGRWPGGGSKKEKEPISLGKGDLGDTYKLIIHQSPRAGGTR
ncbi:hypothetical protein B9Z19DRAFT_136613 [Tuber borchii]|uniref:Uncharacterized protein n=1 Tax=Tuber borchii TaxID=42251 RepID=A0A2T6ZQP0_TUBBO|nr:hypothetical protein B9Z19DRAFT_136613 [Tuber borchii]